MGISHTSSGYGRGQQFSVRWIGFCLVCLFLFVLPLREAIPTVGPISIGRVFGVAFVGVLAARVWEGGIRRPPLFHGLFLAFIVWGGISLLWTPDVGRGVTILARIGLAFVAALAIWDLVETQRQFEVALAALIAGASIVGLFVIGDFVVGGIADRGTMAFGFNAAVISRRMVLCVPLAAYLIARSDRRGLTALAVAFLTIAFVAMLAAVVRQGLVAFAIGSGTFVTLEGLRRWQSRGSAQAGLNIPRKLVATGGVAVAAIVGLGVAVFQMLPDYRTMHLTDISLSGRTDIWAAGWSAFEGANPLLGLGIAAYNTAVGTASSIEFEAAVLWPHSALVGILVELGVIGLVLFLATAVVGFSAAGVEGRDWPLLTTAASIWLPLTLIADVHLDATAWILITLALVGSRVAGPNRPLRRA